MQEGKWCCFWQWYTCLSFQNSLISTRSCYEGFSITKGLARCSKGFQNLLSFSMREAKTTLQDPIFKKYHFFNLVSKNHIWKSLSPNLLSSKYFSSPIDILWILFPLIHFPDNWNNFSELSFSNLNRVFLKDP